MKNIVTVTCSLLFLLVSVSPVLLELACWCSDAEQVWVVPLLSLTHTHTLPTPCWEGSHSCNCTPARAIGNGVAVGRIRGEPRSRWQGAELRRELEISQPKATVEPNYTMNMNNDESVLWWCFVRNMQHSSPNQRNSVAIVVPYHCL